MFRRWVVPNGKRRVREPHQLPAGRHGLPRHVVARNQQGRILAAVADAIAEKGYGAMNVEDVCVRAGVSRRTFYDHYTGKQGVVLAALDAIAEDLLAEVRAAFEDAATPIERVRGCLEAFLGFLARNPAAASLGVVEVLAAGPEAIELRNRVMRALAALIQEGVDEALPRRGAPPALVSETIVGGIYEVAYARILQGRADQLPDLAPDLMYTILLAYGGQEIAAAEHRRARRRRSRATRDN